MGLRRDQGIQPFLFGPPGSIGRDHRERLKDPRVASRCRAMEAGEAPLGGDAPQHHSQRRGGAEGDQADVHPRSCGELGGDQDPLGIQQGAPGDRAQMLQGADRAEEDIRIRAAQGSGGAGRRHEAEAILHPGEQHRPGLHTPHIDGHQLFRVMPCSRRCVSEQGSQGPHRLRAWIRNSARPIRREIPVMRALPNSAPRVKAHTARPNPCRTPHAALRAGDRAGGR
jgi:hypothetical protein